MLTALSVRFKVRCCTFDTFKAVVTSAHLCPIIPLTFRVDLSLFLIKAFSFAGSNYCLQKNCDPDVGITLAQLQGFT